MEFNINNEIIIYPNEKGWEFIRNRLRDSYSLKSNTELNKFIVNNITHDNGFKEQMWCIIEILPELFHQGSDYIKPTIDLVEDCIQPSSEEIQKIQERMDYFNDPKHPWNFRKCPEE